MNIDKADLSKKVLIGVSTLGVTVTAPYFAPYVVPFIAPLVVDCLKAVGQGVLPGITANAVWGIKDSFHPNYENQDLSRLLANAYLEAIDQLLQEVEENDEYANFRDATRYTLPCIKKRIDRALISGKEAELIKLFPSEEYLEKLLTSAQEPEKAHFFLRLFASTKTPDTRIAKELAGKSSAEDFILSIAEDSAAAKQLIVEEIEVSLRRWHREENPEIEEFPVSITPFVFERLGEIIPYEIGELIKKGEYDRSWIAFQRAHLQTLLKEVKNNKSLSEQTVKLLLPLAQKLNALSNIEGLPEELARLSGDCLLGFDRLEIVIETSRVKIIEVVNEGVRRLLEEIEELRRLQEETRKEVGKGNLSLDEMKLKQGRQTFLLEKLLSRAGDTAELRLLADEINRLSEIIKAIEDSAHADCLKPFLRDIKPSESEGVRRFSYYNKIDNFTGRDEIINRLLGEQLATPDSQSPRFQVRYITGKAGAGKSRLALELVHRVKQAWPDSGIIPHDQTKDAIACLCSKEWMPPEPTFIIIDYVTESVENIRTLLISLARRSEDFQHPLRLILLARSSEQDLMNDLISNRSEGGLVEECMLEEIELTGLNSEPCIEIMRGRIQSTGGNQKTHGDEELNDFLELIDKARRPLWAAVAGELIGLNAGLMSTSTNPQGNEKEQQKAIEWILHREFERWKSLESALGGQNQKMLRQKHERLLALATMTRGISLKRVLSLGGEVAPELLPMSRAEFDPSFYEVISDHSVELDQGDYRLAPLEPDLFGEGFVDLLFRDKNQRLFEEDIKEMAWRLDPAGMAQFVVLFEFDFGTVQSDPLRFMPKAAPSERQERVAVSRALVTISYIRVRRLHESEEWSDPSPGARPPLGDKDRREIGDLMRAFESESSRTLPEG